MIIGSSCGMLWRICFLGDGLESLSPFDVVINGYFTCILN